MSPLLTLWLLEPSDSASSSRTSTMVRARRNTLKMTISIVVTFILCWSPYAIMVFWYQLHRQSAEHISGWITSAFFIFAFSSSCVNPLLHSWHLLVAPCSCSRTVQSHRNGLQPKMSRRLNSATLVTQV
ncbi:Gonadotropin-releasing hormone receptor [Halotydeus destructor]|nr:Gonadotropin-releasing hormone receptor [Halotydeus destructor]